jgi:hypothetical protein
MSGITREDRILNEYVRGSIGVVLIEDKMRENRLRLFGHVMRQEETKAVRLVMKINVVEEDQKRDGWVRLRMI